MLNRFIGRTDRFSTLGDVPVPGALAVDVPAGTSTRGGVVEIVRRWRESPPISGYNTRSARVSLHSAALSRSPDGEAAPTLRPERPTGKTSPPPIQTPNQQDIPTADSNTQPGRHPHRRSRFARTPLSHLIFATPFHRKGVATGVVRNGMSVVSFKGAHPLARLGRKLSEPVYNVGFMNQSIGLTTGFIPGPAGREKCQWQR